MGGSFRLELTVHLVRRHVHLVEPPLQERRIVSLQRRVALRQARDLDLLGQDLVVERLTLATRNWDSFANGTHLCKESAWPAQPAGGPHSLRLLADRDSLRSPDSP